MLSSTTTGNTEIRHVPNAGRDFGWVSDWRQVSTLKNSTSGFSLMKTSHFTVQLSFGGFASECSSMLNLPLNVAYCWIIWSLWFNKLICSSNQPHFRKTSMSTLSRIDALNANRGLFCCFVNTAMTLIVFSEGSTIKVPPTRILYIVIYFLCFQGIERLCRSRCRGHHVVQIVRFKKRQRLGLSLPFSLFLQFTYYWVGKSKTFSVPVPLNNRCICQPLENSDLMLCISKAENIDSQLQI